jgi:hypothetical protein
MHYRKTSTLGVLSKKRFDVNPFVALLWRSGLIQEPLMSIISFSREVEI